MNPITAFLRSLFHTPGAGAKTAGTAAGAIAIACSFIMPFEGLYTKAYHDKLAGDIPTVCYGETEGVTMTDEYTPAECAEMLRKKLPRYQAEVRKCIKVAISDKTEAAFISFSYNVGTAGFCGSTALRRLNAGNTSGACDALLMWNKAGNPLREIAGLTRRREAEQKLCLEGI